MSELASDTNSQGKKRLGRYLFGAAFLLLFTILNLQAQFNCATLAVPGAAETFAFGICGTNIVGSYCPTASPFTGFLYNGSTYATVSVPGAYETFAYGISGTNIVGYYEDIEGDTYGFLYNGSTYTTLSVPGAVGTCAQGISGTNIVGYYWNGPPNTFQGFLYNGSTYITLNVPAASETFAFGISGTNVVGYYQDSSGQYGFLYNGNSYTTLSVQGLQTWAYGVSGSNIVGYTHSGGNDYGFLYDGSSYVTFGVPGATGTYAQGISGTNIVGYYIDSSGDEYGFLATPAPAPTVSIQPQIQTVMVGSSAVFNATASGMSPLSFQWLFSGTNIPGATGSSLIVSNAFPVNQGLYTVVVTNLYGSVTSAPAMLSVSPLPLTGPQSDANGQFQFTFDTATGVNYTVQYSTSLTQADWISILTLEGSGGPITIIDPNAARSNQRFYRIVLSAQ